MDLVDALSSNTTARSVVELSLNPHFRRHYTALNKAVAVKALTDQQLAGLASQSIGTPIERKFHLLGTDVTSNPRPFADTLPDRGFVYQPNTIKGNKPVVIGHQYSFWVWLPEYARPKAGNWVVPLSMQRVSSQANKELVGAKQLGDLLANQSLPFGKSFCVEVADSAYSKPAYLNANREHTNLVTIVRARGTRTFYRPSVPEAEPGKKGHPTWYGRPLRLKAPETWGTPDQVAETTFVSRKKIPYRVEIQAWHNLLMRGKKDGPMHQRPFTLVKICWYRPQGQALFQKPLWLIVMGDRRMDLSLLDILRSLLATLRPGTFLSFRQAKAAPRQIPDPRRPT